MFGLYSLFAGKPTQDDWDTVEAIKSKRTMRIEGEWGISVSAEEVMESEAYKEAIRQVRKMEANDSWAC